MNLRPWYENVRRIDASERRSSVGEVVMAGGIEPEGSWAVGRLLVPRLARGRAGPTRLLSGAFLIARRAGPAGCLGEQRKAAAEAARHGCSAR